jgi:single-strand DNA-binding protein
MSQGLNKVILLGNLGADPELRYTQGGQAVLHMRLATNESWLDKNREVKERTEWHDVTVWGPRAEALSKILSKGSCVLVEGRMSTTSYEKDGVRRFRTEVVAREICLTARRSPALPSDDTLIEPPMGERSKTNGSPKSSQDLNDDLPF